MHHRRNLQAAASRAHWSPTAQPAWATLVALVTSLLASPPVVVGPSVGLLPAACAAQGVRRGVLAIIRAATAHNEVQVVMGCEVERVVVGKLLWF